MRRVLSALETNPKRILFFGYPSSILYRLELLFKGFERIRN
ncbi:hypothetical protein LEP1GSC055_2477 [Leptospira borgpetersenii str. Brem 307]|nr:hypothetical protein LEP1GSC055_2477 [Leptospira borgpetersenii str. Brem 307]EMN18660.1 hypothetical protein LEP1GSC056_2194 [Leptospira borgpetersenii str. Brem 328]